MAHLSRNGGTRTSASLGTPKSNYFGVAHDGFRVSGKPRDGNSAFANEYKVCVSNAGGFSPRRETNGKGDRRSVFCSLSRRLFWTSGSLCSPNALPRTKVEAEIYWIFLHLHDLVNVRRTRFSTRNGIYVSGYTVGKNHI